MPKYQTRPLTTPPNEGVPADHWGSWAVFRSGKWWVLFTPTGGGLASFSTQANAKAFLEALIEQFPELLNTQSLPDVLKHRQEIQSLIANPPQRGKTPATDKLQATLGVFVLSGSRKYAELFEGLQEGLRKAEQAFQAAGLGFQGRVPIRIQGKPFGDNRSFYTTDEGGYVQMVPQSLKAPDNFQTLVHELAHFWHNHFVPEGFGNRAIRLKYRQALGEKASGGSETDRLNVQIAMQKRKLDSVKLRKGLEFEVLETEGFSGPRNYVRKYRLERVEGKTAWVQILNPSEYDRAVYRPPYLRKLPFDYVAREVSPEYAQALKVLEELHEQGNQIAFRGEDLGRYQDLRSDWVPTSYARKNELEWFAELVTTLVLHPQILKPEVREWVREAALGQITTP